MPPAVRCPHTGDSQPAHDRPQWEVADIFRLYSDTYRQTQGVSAAQHKVIDAIIACRTAQLGGMQSGVRSVALSAMPIARAGIATVPHVRRGPKSSGWKNGRAPAAAAGDVSLENISSNHRVG